MYDAIPVSGGSSQFSEQKIGSVLTPNSSRTSQGENLLANASARRDILNVPNSTNQSTKTPPLPLKRSNSSTNRPKILPALRKPLRRNQPQKSTRPGCLLRFQCRTVHPPLRYCTKQTPHTPLGLPHGRGKPTPPRVGNDSQGPTLAHREKRNPSTLPAAMNAATSRPAASYPTPGFRARIEMRSERESWDPGSLPCCGVVPSVWAGKTAWRPVAVVMVGRGMVHGLRHGSGSVAGRPSLATASRRGCFGLVAVDIYELTHIFGVFEEPFVDLGEL